MWAAAQNVPAAESHHQSTVKTRPCVQTYKVVAVDPTTAIVGIQDAKDQCHLGRALDCVPSPGDVLLGKAPAIGVLPLRLLPAERACAIALVLIDCDPGIAKHVATVLVSTDVSNNV